MNYLDFYKTGSGIHIKKENKGKFTKSAKAAGEGVQEHAHKVMNDPNATTLQKRRANFAIQAKKWRHQQGGVFYSSEKSLPDAEVKYINEKPIITNTTSTKSTPVSIIPTSTNGWTNFLS